MSNKAEWEGEGLPPVGTVCYAYVRGSGLTKPEKCRIVDYEDHIVCIKWLEFHNKGYHSTTHQGCKFSPIRTEKELEKEQAIEVALAYIQKKRGTQNQIQRQSIYKTVCDVYDAGMLSLPKEGD